MGTSDRKDLIKKRSDKIVKFFKEEGKYTWSQLAKYYVFAINKLLDNNENVEIKKLQNHIFSYLLIPDYRKFEIKCKVASNSKKDIGVIQNAYIDTISNERYVFANNYKLILYSKIYETFRAISNNNNKLKDNDKARLNDFIEVLAMLVPHMMMHWKKI